MYYVREKEGYDKKGIYLIYNTWNDWGLYTTFSLSYYDGNKIEYIGRVKIADLNSEETDKDTISKMKDDYEMLPDNFISLGDVDYYKKLNMISDKLVDIEAKKILKDLNDMAYNIKLYDENKDNFIVKNSLMRSHSEHNLKNQLNRVANGGSELTEYDFTFNYNAYEKVIPLRFKVEPKSLIPNNVHAIIGENGSGKTYLIKEMIKTILKPQNSKNNFKFHKEENKWTNSIPIINNHYNKNEGPRDIFSKVMCISYSYFDTIHEVSKDYSNDDFYTFWGYKSGNLYIDFGQQFKESLLNIFGIKSKKEIWINAMELLDIENQDLQEIINLKFASYDEKSDMKEVTNRFDRLSSGHKSVISMITKIVDYIEEKTLIIIDEPETHLHPPLLSNFMRSISYVLRERNAVSIMATHSPIVLKEISKNNCNIIFKVGDDIKIEKPIQQTYGANINTITNEAFKLNPRNSSYVENILNLINDEEQLDGLIENNEFGDEAMAYIALKRYI